MYDELLSLTSVGSARTMSPGRPTTSVPPSLIAVLGDGAVDAGADPDGAVVGAVVGAGVLAEPWQAANRTAAMATTAPVRIRVMRVSLLLLSRGTGLLPADRHAVETRSPPTRA